MGSLGNELWNLQSHYLLERPRKFIYKFIYKYIIAGFADFYTSVTCVFQHYFTEKKETYRY